MFSPRWGHTSPYLLLWGAIETKTRALQFLNHTFPFASSVRSGCRPRGWSTGKKKEKKNELDSLRSFLPSFSLAGWFWRRVEKSFAAVCFLEGGNRKEKSTAGGGEGVTERERRAGIVRKWSHGGGGERVTKGGGGGRK